MKVTQQQLPNPNITGEGNASKPSAYTSNPYMNVSPRNFASIVPANVPIGTNIQPLYAPVSIPNVQPMDNKMAAEAVDYDNTNKATETKDISTTEYLLAPMESTNEPEKDTLLDNNEFVR